MLLQALGELLEKLLGELLGEDASAGEGMGPLEGCRKINGI